MKGRKKEKGVKDGTFASFGTVVSVGMKDVMQGSPVNVSQNRLLEIIVLLYSLRQEPLMLTPVVYQGFA